MREEKLPLESEFLLFKIIMEVNGMTPRDLANFYVETAFNARSKLKLSKYGIYGIDFSKEENLNQEIDEVLEFDGFEEEFKDSQDCTSDELIDDEEFNEGENFEEDDSDEKPDEDDPDNLCPF